MISVPKEVAVPELIAICVKAPIRALIDRTAPLEWLASHDLSAH